MNTNPASSLPAAIPLIFPSSDDLILNSGGLVSKTISIALSGWIDGRMEWVSAEGVSIYVTYCGVVWLMGPMEYVLGTSEIWMVVL